MELENFPVGFEPSNWDRIWIFFIGRILRISKSKSFDGKLFLYRFADILRERTPVILRRILFSLISIFVGLTRTYWDFTIVPFMAGPSAHFNHILVLLYLSE